MRTICFIGSDKNAGKTTALNFVYSRLKLTPCFCLLTSIGINGENVDEYEGHVKPEIEIQSGDFLITASNWLRNKTGRFEIVHIFTPPLYRKTFVLCRVLLTSAFVLEGPNDKESLKAMKEELNIQCDFLLLDGSIDRQFLADPAICDAFFFALLLSNRQEQLNKAQDLLTPLSLTIMQNPRAMPANQKSLLFGQGVLHVSDKIPYLDEELKAKILACEGNCTLYLKASLSRSLYRFLAPFRHLKIVLDNFTLYQNISTLKNEAVDFRPSILLRTPLNLLGIFLKTESQIRLDLPLDIPVYNLYRGIPHEVRI